MASFDKDAFIQNITSIQNSLECISIDEIQSPYFLQSKEWAKVKGAFGWDAYAFRQSFYEKLEKDVLVLVRYIAPSTYIGYIPDGLLVDTEEHFETERLKESLHACYLLIMAISQELLAKHKRNVFCVRWDMPWVLTKHNASKDESNEPKDIPKQDFDELYERQRTLSTDMQWGNAIRVSLREPTQPPATVTIDLRKDEEALLSLMKSKTRYNTKLAAKKGVVIRDDLSIDEFYNLYEYTSKRNNIAIHSKSYYQTVYDEVSKSNSSAEIKVYGAEYEGVVIAAIVVVYFAKQAIYLYGASSDTHRNLMPAYALQWRAMSDAKHAGCVKYDMFGIPLYLIETTNETHRMHGIYKFKMGFGGDVQYRIGTYEVCNFYGKKALQRKIQHKMFIIVEKIRMWYYYTYKKSK